MENAEYLAQLKGAERDMKEKMERFKDSKDQMEINSRERTKKYLENVQKEIKQLTPSK